jgi:ribosome-associated protein
MNAFKKTSTEKPDSAEQIRMVVAAAEARKAEDLKIFHLAEVSDFTDHFVIMSGTNERQVEALADGIYQSLRDVGVRPLHIEGQKNAHWVLIDYGGDMVIHVFLEETRQFYGLERLWDDAPDVTATFVEAAAPVAASP